MTKAQISRSELTEKALAAYSNGPAVKGEGSFDHSR
jgi:hypothetical protein